MFDLFCHRNLQKIQEAEIAEQKRMAAVLKAEFAAKKAAEAARKQAAPSGYAAVAGGGGDGGGNEAEELFWDYGNASRAVAPQPSPPPPQRPQVRLA